jgi:hypothetical protein
MKNLFAWNKALLLFMIFVMGCINPLLTSDYSGPLNQQITIDKDKIICAYKAYLEYPTDDSAKLFLETLPKNNSVAFSQDVVTVLEYVINNENNYSILEFEAWAGGKHSAEALFYLLNISDGIYSETLHLSLGGLLRINPELFLEVLERYRKSQFVKEMEYPVDMTDPVRADLANRYDLEMRIKALERVQGEKYANLKASCIAQLRKAIKSFNKVIQ